MRTPVVNELCPPRVIVVATPMTAVLVVVVGALLAACTQPDPIPTNNMDRPGAIAFACLRDGEAIPLADCEPPELDVNALVGGNDNLFILLANSELGEIAVVRDRVPFSSGGIGSSISLRVQLLDSDATVPGFTFIPAGDFPVALSTTGDGRFVYSANAGSCSLSRLDVSTLFDDDHREALPAIALPGRPGDAVDLPAGGSLGIDGLLAVTLPDLGQIAIIDPAAFTGDESVVDACDSPAAGTDPHVVAIVDIPVVGTAPAARPNQLDFYAPSGLLYVSDEASDAIAVVDLNDPALPVLVETIDVGAPTGPIGVAPGGEVALVGRLDRSLVLAIDLVSSTLVAPEFPDPVRPETGLVVDGSPRDIVFLEKASDLGIDPTADETSPTHLFGSFAVVATTNGAAYFINVDPEYPEREVGTDSSGDPAILRPYQPPLTVRNIVRDDHAFVSTTPRTFLGPDEVVFDPRTPDPLIPMISTDPVACEAGLTTDACFDENDFDLDNDFGVNLVANATGNESLADITHTRVTHTETWAFIWEGEIVGTERYAGMLVADGALEDPLASFCEHGVRAGLDQVEILDPPLESGSCPAAALASFLDETNRLFPVTLADNGALSLGPNTDGFAVTPACFGDLVAYRVRVQDAFVAVGTFSGFLHNATADLVTGECVYGADPDPGRVFTEAARPGDVNPACAKIGRADLPTMSLTLWYDSCTSTSPGEPRLDSRVTFGVQAGFAPLVLDPVTNSSSGINTASNLAAVARSPVGDLEEIYLVDEGAERVTVWFTGDGITFLGARTIE